MIFYFIIGYQLQDVLVSTPLLARSEIENLVVKWCSNVCGEVHGSDDAEVKEKCVIYQVAYFHANLSMLSLFRWRTVLLW